MAQVQLASVDKLRQEYLQESWVWDAATKADAVLLSSTQRAAYFHTDPVLESTGTAGVRGTRPFNEGEHYWEVTFLEPPCGTSMMVGVGTKHACLHTDNYNFVDLLGHDEHSWGLSYKGTIWHGGKSSHYCDPFYLQSTVIGVYLNLYTGVLAFYKDGQSLGVAFHDLNRVHEDLYPMISSTTTTSELEVGLQTCRFWSLQEKCCHLVVQHMARKEDVSQLPLPTLIKNHLVEVM